MHCTAIKMLYDEHDFILKAIERAEMLIAKPSIPEDIGLLKWMIGFFREYGDKCHHHKEEDILFPLLSEKNNFIGTGIVMELTEHHEQFREMLGDANTAAERQEWEKLKTILKQYISDLRDHIAAENDELFITAEQLLNEHEKENLYFSFLDKEREFGESRKRELENKIESCIIN